MFPLLFVGIVVGSILCAISLYQKFVLGKDATRLLVIGALVGIGSLGLLVLSLLVFASGM